MMEKSITGLHDELKDLRIEVERIIASIVSNDDLSGHPLTGHFHQNAMILENTDLA